MTTLKEAAIKRGTILFFDPRMINVKPGLNARDLTTPDNQEHIEWLAGDIARRGVQQPLVIFQEDDAVYIADGHCRLAATKLAIERGADIKMVPCIQETRGTNDVDRILSQIIFNSGKQLTPFEQGRNFKMALDKGSTVKEISEKIGKSVSYINQMIAFQAAPAEVHNLVKTGEVSTSLAAKLIRKHGKTEGAEMVKKAVEVAKKTGKAKATAKDVTPKDLTWNRVRLWVSKNEKRPAGVSDTDIFNALVLLKEP